MARGYNLLILQRGNQLPNDLMEFLHAKGFAGQLVTDKESILVHTRQMKAPILCVEVDQNEAGAVELLTYLVQRSELHSFPLVLIGDRVERFLQTMQRYFSDVRCLEAHCSHHSILSLLNEILQGYQTEVGHQEANLSSEWDTALQEEAAREARAKQRVVATPKEDDPSELDLGEISLGGEGYHRKFTLSRLAEEGFLPEGGQVNEAVGEVFHQTKRWAQGHLCRTNYVSSNINSVLPVPETVGERSRAASLLFGWGFPKTSSGLMKRPYLPGESGSNRRIGEKIGLSADKIANEMQDGELARMVEQMALLVADGKLPKDEDSAIATSAIVASDLADRLCFQSGAWSPRGAHTLIRKLRGGNLSALHPSSVQCLVKFVNEASVCVPDLSDADAAEQAVREKQNSDSYEPRAGERKVMLPAIEPGMRLSQPITDRNGTVLLEVNTLLDNDLIWRIWQMATLQTLSTPFIVAAE